MAGPQETEIAAWIRAVEEDLAHLDSELAPLITRQAALTERLGLLKRLLVSVGSQTASQPEQGAMSPSTVPVARSNASVRERVQADAVAILRNTGVPMHINDIHAEFIKRGLEVPGAGKPNNITVHLADTPRIRSTSRGFYALDDSSNSTSAVRYPVLDESRGKGAHG